MSLYASQDIVDKGHWKTSVTTERYSFFSRKKIRKTEGWKNNFNVSTYMANSQIRKRFILATYILHHDNWDEYAFTCLKIHCSEDDSIQVMLQTYSVRISSRTPDSLTEGFSGFLKSSQRNSRIVPRIGHNRFLRVSFRFLLPSDATDSNTEGFIK